MHWLSNFEDNSRVIFLPKKPHVVYLAGRSKSNGYTLPFHASIINELPNDLSITFINERKHKKREADAQYNPTQPSNLDQQANSH